MVGEIEAVAKEPAAALAIRPAETAVAATTALAEEVSLEVILMFPAIFNVPPLTKARVWVWMVTLVSTPPPAKAAPMARVAATAEAEDVAAMVAVSSAETVRLPVLVLASAAER